MNNHNSHNTHSQSELESKVLPVSLYLKIFFALLILIFINIGFMLSPIPSQYLIPCLLGVALIQTFLLVFFFMELIHEDKFYSFIFIGTALFVMLFMMISLLELRGRDYFSFEESIHFKTQQENKK